MNWNIIILQIAGMALWSDGKIENNEASSFTWLYFSSR
jgi:hypothetical protein